MEQQLLQQCYKIEYIDAYYSYNEVLEATALSHHEAYGYATELEDCIIVAYIKSNVETPRKSVYIHEGLILPKGALISRRQSAPDLNLKEIPTGSLITVGWQDIVHFKNMSRNSCSTMSTKGILFRKEQDHIVIQTPITTRINPAPIQFHPKKDPGYYVIPNSFIIDIRKYG